MKNDISIYRDMEMLDDEKFILWCLNPTKEMPEDERRELRTRILHDIRKRQE